MQEIDDVPTQESLKTQHHLPSSEEHEKEVSFFDVSWMEPKDRDELASYRLRFSFQKVNFGEYYQDLCKAGWKYVNQVKYRPPDIIDNSNDDDLMTANEIAQHLDYYSLANDIFSNLQIPDTQPATKKRMPRLAAGQENRWRRLREDVVYHFFVRRLKEGGIEGSSDQDETHGTENSRKIANKRGTNERSKFTVKSKNASVTIADAGAEQYFQKCSRKQRKLRQAKQAPSKKVSDGVESEQIPFEPLTIEECREAAKDYPLEEAETMEAEYRTRFEEWRFLLSTNHSLMLYGYGSKLKLLSDFAQEELSKEGYALILNGFDCDMNAESILSLIVRLFLDDREPAPISNSLPGYENEDIINIATSVKDKKSGKMKEVIVKKIRDPIERAKAIGRAIAKNQGKELYPIFLVIHNLEGEGLRNRLSQEILAALLDNCMVKHCGVNAIRLIASIDHVDAPALLWSVSAMTMFSWIWKEVHTCRPYIDELVMLEKDEFSTSNSKKRRSSAGAKKQQAFLVDGEGADRVMEVLRNLATRYTEVIQILATMQLDAQTASPSQQIQWIDAANLLQQCLNKCTVKSDSQLRTFLNELEDHELVIIQKQGSTSVVVRIPYTNEKLYEILAFRPNK